MYKVQHCKMRLYKLVVFFCVGTVLLLTLNSAYLFKEGRMNLYLVLPGPPTLPDPALQPPSQQWIQEQFERSLSYRGMSYKSPPVWKCTYRTYYYPKIRTVFTGIPKTGCSNWKIALSRAEGELKPDRVIESDHVSFIHGGLSGRHRLSSILEAGIYNESHFQEALSFVVVRNPWTRVVSAYRDKASDEVTQGASMAGIRFNIIKTIRGVTDEEVLKDSYPTFEEFVKWLVIRMRSGKPFAIDGHFSPQSKTLCIPNIKYDFVIPLEFTPQMEGELWRKLNVTSPSVLGSYDKTNDPRKQSSTILAKKWLSELEPDLIEEFYSHFKQDFIMMNYSNFSHPDFPLPLVINV